MSSWAQNLMEGMCLSIAWLWSQSRCVACVCRPPGRVVGSRALSVVYTRVPYSAEVCSGHHVPTVTLGFPKERHMSALLILTLAWVRAMGKRQYLECFVQDIGKAAQSHVLGAEAEASQVTKGSSVDQSGEGCWAGEA